MCNLGIVCYFDPIAATPFPDQVLQRDFQPLMDRLESQAGDELALLGLVTQGQLAGIVLGTSGQKGQQCMREAKARLRELAGDVGRALLNAAA